MYTIYKLQSTATDKIYIGCTSKTLKTRLSSHISAFNNDYNLPIYNKIRELNLTIYDFEIVSISSVKDKKEAFKLEQSLIKIFPNVFNYTGKYISDKHRKNMRKAQQKFAREMTPEERKAKGKHAIGNKWGIGKIVSEETRAKISASNMGREGKVNSGSFKKGCNISPETQFKKGQAAWNKGVTGTPTVTKGTITIHKDRTNKRIKPELLNEYLEKGYKKGMKPRLQAKGYTKTKNGKYAAYISIKGKLRHLGTFETKEEAIAAREKVIVNMI